MRGWIAFCSLLFANAVSHFAKPAGEKRSGGARNEFCSHHLTAPNDGTIVILLVVCMETIEQFMLEFFRGRFADPRRFLAVGCHWDGHASAEQAANELIVSTVPSNGGAIVVTRPVSGFRALRYHLRPEGETWLIWNIESECPSCHGTAGDGECDFCAGLGWCPSENIVDAASLPHLKQAIHRRRN